MMFASTMRPSCPTGTRFRLLPRVRTCSALFSALLILLLTAPGLAQERKDQVTRIRNNRVSTLLGTVTKNALDGVEVDVDGKTEKLSSDQVTGIAWGDSPPAFQDARTYDQRKDWANAVAKYRVAASDENARDVIRAAASSGAIESLLNWGAQDPTQFETCIQACDDFIAEHSSNRALPRVRWIQARARLLSGQAAEAALDFRGLYEEGTRTPPSEGYGIDLAIQSGIDAIWAFLEAGDTAATRELLVGLEAPISERLVGLNGESGADALRATLESQQALLKIGEGFCTLVGGQAGNAITWFMPHAENLDLPMAARYAASLGLAQSYAADGQQRMAQIWFARVSAIDHTDRDRVAKALVGLAESTLALQDSDANTQVRRWLTRVTESFGDTPAASKAKDLLAKL